MGGRLGFAVVLRNRSEQRCGVLGGWLGHSGEGGTDLAGLFPTLSCCGSLALLLLRADREADENETRLRQLQRERDTVKDSYSQIMARAIEEREQRLRQQQQYTEHLEEEVAKRSAHLDFIGVRGFFKARKSLSGDRISGSAQNVC